MPAEVDGMSNREDDQDDQPESSDFPLDIRTMTSISGTDQQNVLNIKDINVGDEMDIFDSSNRWCEGLILKIDHDNRRVFVGYLYWDSKYDEWIDDVERRVAPLHTHTYVLGGDLKLGQRLEVLDERGQWIESFVVEEEPSQIKIHFKNFHSKFDTWLDRGSDRIRPFVRLNPRIERRKNAKQWKIPGQHSSNTTPCQFSPRGEFNKENLGDKRPRATEESKNSSSYVPPIAMNGNASVEERKRKIIAASAVYARYEGALAAQQLRVHPVSGDGNCLFRSVSHQVYGDDRFHDVVRAKCVDYMEAEADFFSQFVEGGREAFPLYLQAKRLSGCWGDDPEIEAMCELYNRSAEIWAFDAATGAKKLRTFHEQNNHNASSATSRPTSSGSSGRGVAAVTCRPAMRLSYYGGGHYDSIVGPTYQQHLIRQTPGEVEDANIARSRDRTLYCQRRQNAEAEARTASDVEATEQSALDLALQESRRAQVAADYDDLETCLALSLQQCQQHNGDIFGLDRLLTADSGVGVTDGDSGTEATLPANSSADLIAIQGDLLRSVREESQREYLERALISSLSSEANATDEDLLEQARLASQREYEEQQQLLMLSEGAADNGRDDGLGSGIVAGMTEEEALELALRQSMEAPQSSRTGSMSTSTTVANSFTPSRDCSGHGRTAGSSAAAAGGVPFGPSAAKSLFQLEEEELQMALNASMRSAPPATISSASSRLGGGAFFMTSRDSGIDGSGGGGALEEMDEDLMRAIEESMRRK